MVNLPGHLSDARMSAEIENPLKVAASQVFQFLRPFRDFARNGWPLRGSSGHDWVGRPTVGGWPMTSAHGTAIC